MGSEATTVTTHPVGLEALDALPPLDALCVFVAENERPLVGAAGFVDWRLCGALSRLLQSAFFSGEAGDSLLVATEGSLPVPRVFAVGMGRAGPLTREKLDALLVQAAEILRRAGMREVALELPYGATSEADARSEAVRRAFLPGFGGRRVALLESGAGGGGS